MGPKRATSASSPLTRGRSAYATCDNLLAFGIIPTPLELIPKALDKCSLCLQGGSTIPTPAWACSKRVIGSEATLLATFYLKNDMLSTMLAQL